MPEQQLLTTAQQELYDWLADYIGAHRHSPSIRQMMEAMGLRSPAPVQSRLRHLQQKGWITWQEGQARTLQLLGGMAGGIPVLGAVAAGGSVKCIAVPGGNDAISNVRIKPGGDVFSEAQKAGAGGLAFIRVREGGEIDTIGAIKDNLSIRFDNSI